MKLSRLMQFCVVAWLAVVAVPAGAADYIETPSLEKDVAAGKLPAVAARLPAQPRIIELAGPQRMAGQHGGRLRTLLGRQRDIRFMVVHSYARLVVYDVKFDVVPDILESVNVEEGRIFTLRLRKGHKWSDGHPFTTEDFQYYWDDVFNNKDLWPTGPPPELRAGGKPATFEVVDETTVRYSWPTPNPDFLPALAGAAPVFIFAPAHYLKQFHIKYQKPEKLEQMVAEVKVSNWAALHTQKGRQWVPENPDLPTLDPWRNSTPPPAQQFLFVRNPYFHRVDQKGRQLPYIDAVQVDLGSAELVPAKTGAGESDLQARYLRFSDYTMLKQAEPRHNFTVHLWDAVKAAQIAIYPNLNAADPGWRAILRDVRFRRALSLGINRHEVNQVVFFGLGRESGDGLDPASPIFPLQPDTPWVRFDLKAANALLDEIGLTKRNAEGLRLLPDGRPMEVVVETSGEFTEETDALQLVRDTWKELGIRIHIRALNRDNLRRRALAGETLMATWQGLDNAIPFADMSPKEFAPTSQEKFQWPKWGLYYETNGQSGEAPDMPEAKELMKLLEDWRMARDTETRKRIWQRMLTIYADQVFSVGIVGGGKQPVVATKTLRNVPEKAYYNFDPGAYFGVYMPDTFWFAGAAK